MGRYGRFRLNYLHEQKPEMYRELLLAGKLFKHCISIDKTTFKMAEHYSFEVSKNTPYAAGRYNGTYLLIRTGTRDCR
ncbi:MAG: TnpV protein [Lachnospiraceae bacterium]